MLSEQPRDVARVMNIPMSTAHHGCFSYRTHASEPI